MKLTHPILMLAVGAGIASTVALAEEPQKCNLADMKSSCTITLTVEEWAAIGNTLDEAPVPHRVWGPAWSQVQSQIIAQAARKKGS